MNLYIQQKIFSWGDRFSVYDADGNVKYTVEGEIFTFGRKLHLYDADGIELLYIEQQLLTLLPRYLIYRNGEVEAEVVKEFSFFCPEYSVNGPGWQVQGDFWDHDYDIKDGERVIASVEKEWFTFGDAYEISVLDDANVVTALAVVLVIDACIDAQRN